MVDHNGVWVVNDGPECESSDCRKIISPRDNTIT